MKNAVKFFGIIALVVVIGFSMIACGDGSGDDNGKVKTLSGTVKFAPYHGHRYNNRTGETMIAFSVDGIVHEDRITVTTDLPEPNNSFDLRDGHWILAEGVDKAQGDVVNWTITSTESFIRFYSDHNHDNGIITILSYRDL